MAVRLFYKIQLEIQRDERSLTYRYDELLGWFPKESNQQKFTGYRTISVKHNSYGFRDHEYQIKDKPRIAFLGDSFVWGFDAEEDERFTNKLQKLIPQWEVLNLGVSGYGTDQEFLLLKKWHPIIQPNIFFLVYTAGSDDLDNLKKLISTDTLSHTLPLQTRFSHSKEYPFPKGQIIYFRITPFYSVATSSVGL
ncbi:MAG: SGNH/GDSL hydrolase family protein [Candidatus Latescibacterota bacterium]